MRGAGHGLDDPDYRKLMTLAMWLDVKDDRDGNTEPGHDEVQKDLRRIARRLIDVPAAPPRDVTEVGDLIHKGCVAADIHLTCSWPDCTCTHIPTAVKAVLSALSAPARVDAGPGENALSIGLLPEGWSFHGIILRNGANRVTAQGLNHTPKTAFLAAIEAARERGT